jgi:flagellar biosynthesis/type III secretory pathway protein FliH
MSGSLIFAPPHSCTGIFCSKVILQQSPLQQDALILHLRCDLAQVPEEGRAQDRVHASRFVRIRLPLWELG